MGKNIIKITTDASCEMIKIENKYGKIVFEGNESDFNRDANTFKKLLAELGLKVEIFEKPYEEWN